MFNILEPSRCEQNPSLRTLMVAAFSNAKGQYQRPRVTTHNPTPVTDTTSTEKPVLSCRSAAENHRQNCPRTRPVRTPCMKRPAMPGPNTSAWLGNALAGERVELDMVSDDEAVAARRGGHSRGLEARRRRAQVGGRGAHKGNVYCDNEQRKWRINYKYFLHSRGPTHRFRCACLAVGGVHLALASFGETMPNFFFFYCKGKR